MEEHNGNYVSFRGCTNPLATTFDVNLSRGK